MEVCVITFLFEIKRGIMDQARDNYFCPLLADILAI